MFLMPSLLWLILWITCINAFLPHKLRTIKSAINVSVQKASISVGPSTSFNDFPIYVEAPGEINKSSFCKDIYQLTELIDEEIVTNIIKFHGNGQVIFLQPEKSHDLQSITGTWRYQDNTFKMHIARNFKV
jgi:hypothetical protein